MKRVTNKAAASVQATFAQAFALHQSGHFEQAQALYRKVLKAQPGHFDSLHLLGVTFAQTGEPEKAVELIAQAIAASPNDAAAHRNLAAAFDAQGLHERALACHDCLIALEPDSAGTFNQHGLALLKLDRVYEALASYDKALVLDPGHVEALANRSHALLRLKRLDEALASADKGVALRPDSAHAHISRANALVELRRLDEAVASCDQALAIAPDNAVAHGNRGIALAQQKKFDQAIASYDRAIALWPQHADALANRGNALVEMKRLEEAAASFEKAFTFKPWSGYLLGMLLHVKMGICDWAGFCENRRLLESSLRGMTSSVAPFVVLALCDDPALLLAASSGYSKGAYFRNDVLGPIAPRPPGDKIKVGYYSADFHNHATSLLMIELLEAHRADRFELYGFSFGPDSDDPMRQRICTAFDRFIDVRAMSDREIAQLSREQGIDIAVDLKGHTQFARTGIFAQGCAPIQVNFLGYPGTMGAEYIDYIIADKTVIPQESQQHYSEKVVYLPHSYQVNDSGRRIAGREFTRSEVGLPQEAFVFCCFNNNYKILPETFDGWMRILKAVEGSVLWLLEDNAPAAGNLRREAQARGVDPQRLVFAQRMKLDEHLARHRLADLFIDTFPCNAHTTASDALWAGLPLLTRMGQSFASRVAASLLNAVGLPELITRSQQEYEALAIQVATTSGRCGELKARLWANRESTPLFNGRLFAQHIEQAYEAMYACQHAGSKPVCIEVQPDVSAHLERGRVCLVLQQPQDALASADSALALQADNAGAWEIRANALAQLRRLAEAVADFDKVLCLKPDKVDVHVNRAKALTELRRLDAALQSYDKALTLCPEHVDALINRAFVLSQLYRFDDALASARKAVSLRPEDANANVALGNLLHDMRRLEEAAASYERPLASRPEFDFLLGTYVAVRMKMCDWRSLARDQGLLANRIASSRKASPPFSVLSLFDDPQLQRQAAETFAQASFPRRGGLGPLRARAPDGKIRIGYFSADFYNHATAFLMIQLLESHDTRRFEVYGFSFGPDPDDDMRKRLPAAFRKFFEVRHQSDRAIAQLARDCGIDIAIDLKGYTQNLRTGSCPGSLASTSRST